MPLTDTKIKAIYAKAQRGETVGKESDGGGLNFQSGKYWRLSYRFGGKQKTLAIGVYPDVSLKAARVAREKARLLPALLGGKCGGLSGKASRIPAATSY